MKCLLSLVVVLLLSGCATTNNQATPSPTSRAATVAAPVPVVSVSPATTIAVLRTPAPTPVVLQCSASDASLAITTLYVDLRAVLDATERTAAETSQQLQQTMPQEIQALQQHAGNLRLISLPVCAGAAKLAASTWADDELDYFLTWNKSGGKDKALDGIGDRAQADHETLNDLLRQLNAQLAQQP